jgi:hypothetical protein
MRPNPRCEALLATAAMEHDSSPAPVRLRVHHHGKPGLDATTTRAALPPRAQHHTNDTTNRPILSVCLLTRTKPSSRTKPKMAEYCGRYMPESSRRSTNCGYCLMTAWCSRVRPLHFHPPPPPPCSFYTENHERNSSPSLTGKGCS